VSDTVSCSDVPVRGDPDDAVDPGFDDGDWGAVEVLHCWSIEGLFDPGHADREWAHTLCAFRYLVEP